MEPGGQVPAACPCAFGWNDPTLIPDGWQPVCEVYDSGEGGSSVTILGDPESPGDVMITAGWNNGEYSWGNMAGFTCGWAGSDTGVGKSGWVDFSDQDLVAEEPLDGTPYLNLYASCEAELGRFLARFGKTLDDCTVIEN